MNMRAKMAYSRICGMGVLCALWAVLAACPAGAGVYINEFMASSSTNGLVDPQEAGEYPDWIELYNSDGTPVDISGWYITDNLASPNKFQITNGIVPAGGVYLLYADNDPEQGSNHLGIALSSGGEAVGISSDGITFVDSITFGAQAQDESLGRFPDGTGPWLKMIAATPNATNETGYLGEVADTKFFPDRGFFTSAFQVSITSRTAGAEIYYTTNFEMPTTNDTLYTNSFMITNSTCLRAAAFKTGWKPTDVDTHTYIFINDVLNQPTNPAGFPMIWGGTNADYEVSRRIVTNSAYVSEITNGLLSLPSISIVTATSNMFDSATGIYANALMSGIGWEKPVSAELIYPDGTNEGFQINCGIRIYGGYGRNPEYKKNSFRLFFKGDYGPTKLRYPLFGEDAVDEFDTIILRAGFNYKWHGQQGGSSSQYFKDQFTRDCQLAMGSPSPHGIIAHLYINGLYWGLYNPVERPDTSFAASYFGGEKEEWDALNSNDPTGDSNNESWTNAHAIALSGSGDNNHYTNLAHYVDMPNFIDYLLLNFYAATGDWDHHNWYIAKRRVDGEGFKFFTWDSEWAWENQSDKTLMFNMNCPSAFYQWMKVNEEFRILWGDRVHKHMFNDGAITLSNNLARWQKMSDSVYTAVICESARWGDSINQPAPELAYTRDDHWIPGRDSMVSNKLPTRATNMVAVFKGANLYPSVAAPVFTIDGSYQHGGMITNGAMFNMTAFSYYTLDGADPREWGTGTAVGTLTFGTASPLMRNTLVKARVPTWSALNEAVYTLDTPSPLRITEIMYNPRPPQAGTAETNYIATDFEYVELKNAGTEVIGLAGLEFTRGVRFNFNDTGVVYGTNVLGIGEYVLLVRNLEAFTNRYSNWTNMNIAGEYKDRFNQRRGSLSDGGERLTLVDGLNREIHDFDYEDDWHPVTDGEGYSLTIIDPDGDISNWDTKTGWRYSAFTNGSPGTDDSGSILYPFGTVVINEALTHQDQDDPGDWIELHNTSAGTVDVLDWFLSDRADNLTKYRITNSTPIPAGGYAVFTEWSHFGTNSMGTNGFALSEHGEAVYLSYGTNGALAEPVYREFEEFSAAEKNVTFGRHVKSDGNVDFTAMEYPTTNAPNSDPLIGPVVINEIMYNPTNLQYEFIEIVNMTDSTVELYDVANPSNAWKLSGVSYTFPTNITMTNNEALLLARDTILPEDFRTSNGIPAGVQIFSFEGALDNDTDTLTLKKPVTPDETGVPYVTVDMVKYNDSMPWPVLPDGDGYTLLRKNPLAYGNDVANWGVGVYGGAPSEQPEFFQWLLGYYPGITSYVETAAGDTDYDGMTAEDEFTAGTIPTDGMSLLMAFAPEPDGTGYRVQWLSVTDRYYAVYKSTNLLEGWMSPALTSGCWGVLGGTNFITDDTSVDNKAYYLIQTELP